MKVIWLIVEVMVTAVVAGLAAAAATWVWNLAAHGAAAVDWTSVVRLALILGVGLPVTRRAAAPRGGSCVGR